MPFLIGLSVLWLLFAIPAHTTLRKVMISAHSSVVERMFFVLISSAMLAPGLLSGGHPPPIPVPMPFGAPLLGLFAVLNGRHGESGSFFVIGNLVSWLVVTVIVGLIELLQTSKLKPESQPGFTVGEKTEAQPLQGSSPLVKPANSRQYLAEFTSTTVGAALYHRAIVDESCDGLTLSVYEGTSNRHLVLVQTYMARNWDELSLYLQSRTSFRRGDFHAPS